MVIAKRLLGRAWELKERKEEERRGPREHHGFETKTYERAEVVRS